MQNLLNIVGVISHVSTTFTPTLDIRYNFA